MIRATSMEKIERRLSDHYEEAIARLSLFEMRQAWASSKLFNDRPFRPRRLSSCPAPGAQRLATHGSQSRRRRSSNFTVMVTLTIGNMKGVVINCTYLQFQLPKEESEDNIGRLVNQSTFDSESDKEDECRKSSGSYNVQRGSWRNLSIVSNLANLTQDVKGFCLKQISKGKWLALKSGWQISATISEASSYIYY